MRTGEVLREAEEADEHHARRMHEIADASYDDPEIWHELADRELCDVLTRLGYRKTVAAFMQVIKWYR